MKNYNNFNEKSNNIVLLITDLPVVDESISIPYALKKALKNIRNIIDIPQEEVDLLTHVDVVMWEIEKYEETFLINEVSNIDYLPQSNYIKMSLSEFNDINNIEKTFYEIIPKLLKIKDFNL